jgi:cell division septal protein FtsQ
MAKKKPAGRRPDKQGSRNKGFWSNFFERVPEDDESGFFAARREEQESVPPPSVLAEEEALFSAERDIADARRLFWDDGEPVVRGPYSSDGPLPIERGQADGARSSRYGGEDAASGAERSYTGSYARQDTGSFTRRDSGRMRAVKTGETTTTRINMNNTEEAMRRAEAARQARAREAKRRHEEYMERQSRKRKRRAAMRKLFGNIAFVILIVVGLLVTFYYVFLLSDIVVTGNEAYSSQYIIDLSGLKLGRHILLCDMDEAAENISEDPYLSVESVTYIFPSRIRISVEERKEVAGIIGLDYNVIIDRSGYVLAVGAGMDLSGLIQVTGVSMTGFQLGERLGEGDDFSTATLVNLISALEAYNLVGEVASIDLTTPLAITLRVKNGLTIFIGQPTELEAKMASLYKILPQFTSQSISAGTLYLSAKGSPVYSPSSDGARLPVLDTPAAEPEYDQDGNLITPPDDSTTLDTPNSPSSPTTPSPGSSLGSDDPFSG